MPSGNVPPAPAGPLIGRAAELSRVHDLLAGASLVTLTGPPGVGKTRLAMEVCRELDGRTEPVWVDLSPLRDPSQVRSEVLRAVAAGPSRDREVLLVLDNCEHLLDADPDRDLAGVLSELMRSRPDLHVLATSRERLRLAAERELPVPPLPMPSDEDVGDLEALCRNPAVAMLLDRSPAAVRVTPGSARALADVCVGLDGLPLALELAAARLRVFTPSELAFRLERRMALLTSSPRDAPERHRDLRTAIAWSHDLLPEPERTAFRRLSVFPGDWTLDGAEAVCDQPGLLGLVESLLDKNLIQRAGSGDVARFTMLMSLREYAAEQLDESADGPVARDRHATWFATRAREWEAAVGTETETASWLLLGQFRADLRAALDHSADPDDADTGTDAERTVWLAVALLWLCYTRGVLAESAGPLAVLTGVLASAELGPEAEAAARLAAGVVSYGLGDHESAERHLAAVSVTDEEPGDRRPAVARAFLGHVARERGDLELAEQRYLEARAVYERLGNSRGTAWAGHDLALLALERDDDAEAETLLRESMRLFASIDYDWATAVCASQLASVIAHRGTPRAVDEAATLLGRALTLHERVDDRRGVAQTLEALAEVALARGAAAAAARLLGASTFRRDQAEAGPTEAESRRLADLTARVERSLGVAAADHERHAGRTMPADDVLQLARRLTAVGAPEAEATGVELTARQLEVAALVAAGHTNRQIGKELGISEKTTEIHVHNLMSRLDVPSRAGVAAWAAARGLEPHAGTDTETP